MANPPSRFIRTVLELLRPLQSAPRLSRRSTLWDDPRIKDQGAACCKTRCRKLDAVLLLHPLGSDESESPNIARRPPRRRQRASYYGSKLPAGCPRAPTRGVPAARSPSARMVERTRVGARKRSCFIEVPSRIVGCFRAVFRF